MKKKRTLLAFQMIGVFILSSCSNRIIIKTSVNSSGESSFPPEDNSSASISESIPEESSLESTSKTISEESSETTEEYKNKYQIENKTIEYTNVSNSSWPTDNKTYRIPAIKVNGDEFTVYNVRYDTEKYLSYPTTLTIKKTDYCLTYETVALYYQAFRCVPPNYYSKSDLKAMSSVDSSYRVMQTFTYGSYKGSSSYTEAFGTFNNTNNGKYLELDIALSGSYSYSKRGQGRVVVVVDGVTDYGSDPVCFLTLDHYYNFSEFYNYATGWGEKFKGIGSTTSLRKIPLTITQG